MKFKRGTNSKVAMGGDLMGQTFLSAPPALGLSRYLSGYFLIRRFLRDPFL
jgi:hypothetical protein